MRKPVLFSLSCFLLAGSPWLNAEEVQPPVPAPEEQAVTPR